MPKPTTARAEAAQSLAADTLARAGLPALADPAALKRRPKDEGEPLVGAEGTVQPEHAFLPSTKKAPDEQPADAPTGGPLAALSTADLKAVRARGGAWLLALGMSPRGPLRIATSSDPGNALRLARMHSVGVGEIDAHVALLAPDATAAWGVREALLESFAADGDVIRAGLVNGDAACVMDAAHKAASVAGLRLLTPIEVRDGLSRKV